MRHHQRMEVQILGSGTPLAEGGRMQSAFLIGVGTRRIMVDCGMTALVGLARARVDSTELSAVLISHLHGDHFGGLPLLLLERAARRVRQPLIVAGPEGTAEAVQAALEVLRWPRAWAYAHDTSVEFVVLRERERAYMADFEVRAFGVPHYPGTAPLALRIEKDGQVVGYSGDSGWSETLVEVADGADLFICNVLEFDEPDPLFLDYRTFRERRDRFAARRIILTHLGESVLAHRGEIEAELAEDGMTLSI